MNIRTLELLEFGKITEWLASYSRTEMGKERLQALLPLTDRASIEKRLAETTEARAIVDARSAVPIHSLMGIEAAFQRLDKGSILSPQQCETIAGFLGECQKLQIFMKTMEDTAPMLSAWAASLTPFEALREAIQEMIICGEVADGATPLLSRLTRSIQKAEDKIKQKMESVVRELSQKDMLQENHISQRNGRYVIAVKNHHWRGVAGTARDRSGSGSTVFIEPEAVRLMQEEIEILRFEADAERERILADLSAKLAENRVKLEINKDCMIAYDQVVARGKLSRAMNGRAAELRNDDRVVVNRGRHPLLGDKAVPLDYDLPAKARGLIITGPNTGGKTVVLKTVGLMAAMTQTGLHIPAERGTSCGIFANILADIGDGQSLSQNLSTFSAHMTTLSDIMKAAGPQCLVLLDEMGSGTDPVEGMALAAAILSHLHDRGAMILATTHFVEIKRFADQKSGFVNGAMGFDLHTLSPQYKLSIGRVGQSHGIHIAEKLGLPSEIIASAKAIAGQDVDGNHFEPEVEKFETIPHEAAPLPEPVAQAVSKPAAKHFDLGDAVKIPYMKEMGIIVASEDKRGEYVVQVHGKRIKIGKKRLELYIPGSELYPEDYDMDIVTKSKLHRKQEKKIRKGHLGVVLVHDPGKRD